MLFRSWRDFEYLDEEADCTASCSPYQTDGFFTRKLKETLKTAHPYQKRKGRLKPQIRFQTTFFDNKSLMAITQHNT